MSSPAAASSSADVDAADVDEQKQNLSKEQAAEAGQLDKVTDFAEEVEMDEAKSQQVRGGNTNNEERMMRGADDTTPARLLSRLERCVCARHAAVLTPLSLLFCPCAVRC